MNHPAESACHNGIRIAQLELLLREAYHRIANSLQLASAIVQREANISHDHSARARLAVTGRHIEAIAEVHALLSQEQSKEAIPLDEYLARLTARIERSVANDDCNRIISLQCAPMDVSAEAAVGLGMIVNELVGNACKYAYLWDQHGEIRVRLIISRRIFTLDVQDDGTGFAHGKEADGSGLGTSMIGAMARRFNAVFRYEDCAFGVRAVIQGPASSLTLGRSVSVDNNVSPDEKNANGEGTSLLI